MANTAYDEMYPMSRDEQFERRAWAVMTDEQKLQEAQRSTAARMNNWHGEAIAEDAERTVAAFKETKWCPVDSECDYYGDAAEITIHTATAHVTPGSELITSADCRALAMAVRLRNEGGRFTAVHDIVRNGPISENQFRSNAYAAMIAAGRDLTGAETSFHRIG
jgi:hypothetical protein